MAIYNAVLDKTILSENIYEKKKVSQRIRC